MRRIRYAVAMSLDGYIAGPDGEADWIIMDPDIDFGEIMSEFDTLLIGGRTFAALAQMQGGDVPAMPGMKVIVFSRTLKQADFPDVTMVSGDPGPILEPLRREPGKDIWLFGGGLLFRSLLEAGYVDGVGVAVIPVLLGGGIPFLPPPTQRAELQLLTHRLYEKSGVVSLEYSVRKRAG